MAKREKDWAAKRIEFIFAEISRISPLLGAGGSARLREEAFFHTIKASSGNGSFPIGKQGGLAVEELANEALNRNNLSGRAHNSEAKTFLKKHLASLMPVDTEPVSPDAADKLLRDAGRAVAKKCTTRTHFFPVHITTDQRPARLDLGVIQIHSKALLNERLCEVEPMLKKSNGSEADRDADAKHLALIFDYYRSFNWVAEVTIDKCDRQTSRKLGAASVRTAMELLRLIVGRRHAYKFNAAAVQPENSNNYHFAFDADGNTFREWKGSSVTELSFNDEMADVLCEPDEAFFMEKARAILPGAVMPNCDWPLTLRFFDALHWYGESIADKQTAASFVKYMLCIERLLMTDERSDITNTLVERAASLGMPPHLRSAESRENLREKTRRIYDLRSKIVHGAISPNDPKIAAGIADCGDLAEHLLKMYMVAFTSSEFTDPTYRPTRLAKWFDNLDTYLTSTYG